MNKMSFFFYIALLGIGMIALSLLGHDHVFSHSNGLHLEHTSADNQNPGFFNLRVMSVFIATAGCSGIFAEWWGASENTSNLIAFLGGLLFADIARRLIYKLITLQGQSNMDNDYIDLIGTVNLPIPENGPGEVNIITKNGQKTWLTAYAVDKAPMEMGTRVKIISSSGNTVNVIKDL